MRYTMKFNWRVGSMCLCGIGIIANILNERFIMGIFFLALVFTSFVAVECRIRFVSLWQVIFVFYLSSAYLILSRICLQAIHLWLHIGNDIYHFVTEKSYYVHLVNLNEAPSSWCYKKSHLFFSLSHTPMTMFSFFSYSYYIRTKFLKVIAKSFHFFVFLKSVVSLFNKT